MLTLRATVFDDADPTQFSPVFERDLSFDALPPLRVMAVGKGDSDDIVYGLFNVGVDTGSVGGCGGGGVGVGRIGRQATAAHELGHALGRKHGPCDNVTRCTTPRNTDDTECGCSRYDGAEATKIRQAVPFPARAQRMHLLRCDDLIEEWPIGEPPDVDVDVDCDDDGPYDSDVTISWDIKDSPEETTSETTGSDHHYDYWALVQWRDRFGTWRGLAPRTQEREISVRRSVLGPDRVVHVRVLVTSDISTGSAEWSGPCGAPPPPSGPDAPRLVLIGVADGGPRVQSRGTLKVAVAGSRARPRGTIRWHGSRGGELGRGRTLNLRALPVGQTVVTASLVGASERTPAAQWLIERTPDGRFFLLEGDQHPPDPCAPPDEPDDDGHDHDNDGGAAPRHRSATHTHDGKDD